MAKATYEVQTEDGVYEVDVEEPQSGDTTLPNLDATESKISSREDLIPQAFSEIKKNPTSMTASLQLLGGVTQRGEASIANPAIEIQKGNFGGVLESALQAMSGKREAQLGDIIRNTGWGGKYNEPLAVATGMLAMGAVDKLTGEKVSQLVGKLSNQATSATKQIVADSITNRTGFLDDIRTAFYQSKSSASERFGMGLERLSADNPDKVVDLKPVIEQLSQDISESPKLRNAINKVPGLKELVEDPKLSSKVKLIDAQKIVNELQSKVSQSKLQGMSIRPDDLPLLDAIHDIKGQQLEAFPDLVDLRQDYGKVMNDFRMIRNKIKPGSLYKSVKENFGGDPETTDAVKRLLNDNPDILTRVKQFQAARTATKALAWVTGAEALRRVAS